MTSDTNEVQGINFYLGNDFVMIGNGHDILIFDTRHIIFPTTNLKLNNALVVLPIKKKLLSLS